MINNNVCVERSIDGKPLYHVGNILFRIEMIVIFEPQFHGKFAAIIHDNM